MKKLLAVAVLIITVSCPSHAFKAVITGDSRNDNKGILPAIAREAAKTADLAAFVHTGDMTGAGRADEYAVFKKAVAPLKVPILAVPGNHERKAIGNYVKNVGPLYGTRKMGAWRFVLIDNSQNKLGNEQVSWLKRTLAQAKANREHVAMVTHIPFYFPGRDQVMGGKDRKTLLGLIKDYRVKLVASGHIHSYAKVERDGTIFLTTGGAGAPLYGSGSFHHYVLADFRDDGSVGLSVKKVSGRKGEN